MQHYSSSNSIMIKVAGSFRFCQVIAFIFLIAACKTKQSQKAKYSVQNTIDSIKKTSIYRSMPSSNSYLMDQFASQLQANPNQLDAKIYYANQMTFMNYPDQGIQLLDQVINDLKRMNQLNPKLDSVLNRMKAIAAIRLGEKDNCQQYHNAESCLMPFHKDAQHKVKTGSELAIELYTKLLELYPNDHTFIWLLNIAHMTLGTYPEGVPKKFLLPVSKFKNETAFPKFQNISLENQTAINESAGGVCVEDFDNDGYLDIIATGWASKESIQYLHNDHSGKFSSWTEKAGLKGQMGGLHVVQADYNNDGWMDFLVMRGAWLFGQGLPNSLYKNNGDNTFTDVTIESGIFAVHPSQAAVFADFNNDGWLDLVIGNESKPGEDRKIEFYINQKNGKYKNEVLKTGLDFASLIKGICAGDINNDGWMDLYISRLNDYNMLFLNLGNQSDGIPKFEDISLNAGVLKPRESFACWMFDFNNDGWLDIYVNAYNTSLFGYTGEEFALAALNKKFRSEIPGLYINQKNNSFKDIASETDLNTPLFPMGCGFGDLDNDGFEDIYLGTGEPNLESIIPNKMFLNKGGTDLKDISYSGGFAHLQKGHGISFADFDCDGDQDIYAVMGGAYEGDRFPNAFFENPHQNNVFVSVRLKGEQSNRQGIGSRIKMTIKNAKGEEKAFHRQMSHGSSFGSNPYVAHFGFEQGAQLISCEVFWPIKYQWIKYDGLKLNQFYELSESNDVRVIPCQIFSWAKNSGEHSHIH